MSVYRPYPDPAIRFFVYKNADLRKVNMLLLWPVCVVLVYLIIKILSTFPSIFVAFSAPLKKLYFFASVIKLNEYSKNHNNCQFSAGKRIVMRCICTLFILKKTQTYEDSENKSKRYKH